MLEVVKMFEEDPETKYIVVIGEIGGTMEERLAQYIGSGKVTKPVVATYQVGQHHQAREWDMQEP